MTPMTGQDLAKAILRKCRAYQSGETLASVDATDVLQAVNIMIDAWSTDEMMVFGSNENIFQWVPGKRQYTIGNPLCTDLGFVPFGATVSNTSNTLTGVTVPSNLLLGATVTSLQNLLPPGTTVTGINASANTVTLSGNATGNSTGLDSITYTIPGDFAIPRPLRITNGFTRFNQLDFELNVYGTEEQYTSILYKFQPGPWPVLAWYNNLFPYGVLNIYQSPGNAAEVHLFTDTVLTDITLTSTFLMPQGYARALIWLGAAEVWTEYHGTELPPIIAKNAGDSMAMIKALNAAPAKVASYERALIGGGRVSAGWIMNGGFS